MSSPFTVLGQYPAHNDQRVSEKTDLVLTIGGPPGSVWVPQNTYIEIDGELAWNADSGFVYPGFSGQSSPLYLGVTQQFTVTIRPRRRFVYGVKVTVTGQLSTIFPVVATAPLPDWEFYVTPEPDLPNARVERNTVYDRPFQDVTALRAFQQILLGTLIGPSTASTQIVLKRHVNTTSLRSLLTTQGPEAEREAGQLELVRRSDIVNSTNAIEQLARVAVLWPGAMEELQSLGVPPPTTRLLTEVWDTENGVNRLSAACAAFLFAGERL